MNDIETENRLLKEENEKLKRKQNKWIEKDKKLIGRKRVSRLVTYLDIADPEFMEKYPHAHIGDEILEGKPLLFKVGFKREPTIQEKHAQVMASVRNQLAEEMELDDDEDLFEDDLDPDMPALTQAELQGALYDAAPHPRDVIQNTSPTPTHAKPSEAGEVLEPSSGASDAEGIAKQSDEGAN
jgi:hypothetical protein